MSEAARSRKKRERKREGRLIVPVPVSYDDTDALCDMGLLGAWDERNREAIASAILRLLAATRGDPTEADLLDPCESKSPFSEESQ